MGLQVEHGDQSQLDLSDIVPEDPDHDDALEIVEEEKKDMLGSEMEVFEALPVVWSGGVSHSTFWRI